MREGRKGHLPPHSLTETIVVSPYSSTSRTLISRILDGSKSLVYRGHPLVRDCTVRNPAATGGHGDGQWHKVWSASERQRVLDAPLVRGVWHKAWEAHSDHSAVGQGHLTRGRLKPPRAGWEASQVESAARNPRNNLVPGHEWGPFDRLTRVQTLRNYCALDGTARSRHRPLSGLDGNINIIYKIYSQTNTLKIYT